MKFPRSLIVSCSMITGLVCFDTHTIFLREVGVLITLKHRIHLHSEVPRPKRLSNLKIPQRASRSLSQQSASSGRHETNSSLDFITLLFLKKTEGLKTNHSRISRRWSRQLNAEVKRSSGHYLR